MAIREFVSRLIVMLAALASMSLIAAPVAAQVQSVDPDTAIDGDLMGGDRSAPPAVAQDTPEPWIDITAEPSAGNGTPVETVQSNGIDSWDSAATGTDRIATAESTTYRKDDLLGAAEGVFGKGSEGLASIIEDLLSKQGEPNGYIVGREGGGAVAIGLRYGSGTLFHKVEGNRPVYWTGPSLGFDLGLNAGNAFVLVYNLNDTQELFHRFAAGEGQAYFIGGFNVSYLRRGNIVLIPVRMGAGVRLGANVGYMKFSEKQKWLPF